MTRKIGRHLVIEVEPPGKCDLCGKIAELRPYGPKGEKICFECGMKDPETTKQKFREMFELSENKANNSIRLRLS